MQRLFLVSVLVFLVSACVVNGPTPTTSPAAPSDVPLMPSRPLGAGETWLPTFPTRTAEGVPILCGGVGFVGEYRVHGSPADPHLVWMTQPDGGRRELVWPVGYSARFTPDLEILDDEGHVIAQEGSLATGGCEMPPAGSWWVDFTPQQ